MLHDIQNFSDLTAIDTKRKLIVDVRLRKHGYTHSNITFNGFAIYTDHFTFELDLFDPITFEIELLDFKEGTSGIEIESLTVNGYEVLPKYQHLASEPTNYVDKLGIWYMSIPSPFYVWYHQITGQGWIA